MTSLLLLLVDLFALRRRVIDGYDAAPYMTKYEIFPRTRGIALHLHRFHRPDVDDDVHNHPWRWGVSLVLAGGYTEEVWRAGRSRALREHTPGSVYALTANTFHRAARLLDGECWTLFLSGPIVQSWGFLDDRTAPATFTHWKTFLEARHAVHRSHGKDDTHGAAT